MHPKPKRKSGVYIVSLDNIGNEHGMQNYLYSGWKINSYTNKIKNHNPIYVIERSNLLFIKRKEIFYPAKQMHRHIRNECAGTISYLHISIEERVYIINNEKI